MKENKLLVNLRNGNTLNFSQQVLLVIQLSLPAIASQISQVVMEYIDSSMVGHLGAEGSAAIGLVASSTWLGGSLLSAFAIGFTVQVAQFVGARDNRKARELVHESMIIMLIWSILIATVGSLVSSRLPIWLGGSPEIIEPAAWYFRIFALSAPIMGTVWIASGMLESSGNLLIPSFTHVFICFLDVVFNYFLIFPARTVLLGGHHFAIPGANLGVAGAALGTACAQAVGCVIVLIFLLFKSPILKKRKDETYHFHKDDLKRAAKIGIPVGIESCILTSAQILSTMIVAPLGTVAIAAHSLSITAEGLCYMPCYGIQKAATTLIGQSIGAKRDDLVRRLSWFTTIFGMLIMTLTGILMYMIAPVMIGVMTADLAVKMLGTKILRIEAFAEPWYGASIVANGAFRGAGDTVIPTIMNLMGMWIIRLPLAYYLSLHYGLTGVWIAMAVELTFRGIIFLVRLSGRSWKKYQI